MAAITAEMVVRLRNEVDESMMQCKKYLYMFDGDYDAALRYIRETPYHERYRFVLDATRGRCKHCGKPLD